MPVGTKGTKKITKITMVTNGNFMEKKEFINSKKFTTRLLLTVTVIGGKS